MVKCGTKNGAKFSEEHKKKISESMKGKRNSWKGGRIVHPRGYVYIRINGKYVPEHRIVMEEHLGRKLEPSEVPHHINGNKSDNSIKNLVVLKNNSENIKEHHKTVREALKQYRANN